MSPMGKTWLPMLPKNRQFLLALLAVFSLSYVVLVVFYHEKTEEYALGMAENAARDALISHRAVRASALGLHRPTNYATGTDIID